MSKQDKDKADKDKDAKEDAKEELAASRGSNDPKPGSDPNEVAAPMAPSPAAPSIQPGAPMPTTGLGGQPAVTPPGAADVVAAPMDPSPAAPSMPPGSHVPIGHAAVASTPAVRTLGAAPVPAGSKRVHVRSTHGTVRIGAGFWFGVQAMEVDVTEAQLAEILADPVLLVTTPDGEVLTPPPPVRSPEDGPVYPDNVQANPGGLPENRRAPSPPRDPNEPVRNVDVMANPAGIEEPMQHTTQESRAAALRGSAHPPSTSAHPPAKSNHPPKR